jgi:hypothetical protein
MFKRLILVSLFVLLTPMFLSAGLVDEAITSARMKSEAYVISTNSGTPSAVLKWTGSGVTGYVAVAAGGDWTLYKSSGNPDSSVGIPTSNGIIDVSDTDADTWLEVAAHLNASTNWELNLLGALPSHSTNNTLAALSATNNCSNAAGVKLYADPAVACTTGIYGGCGTAIKGGYFYKTSTNSDEVEEYDIFNSLYRITYNLTYGSGTAFIDVYEATNRTQNHIGRFSAAATTVEKDINFYGNEMMRGQRGYRIVVYPVNGTAAFTAGAASCAGKSWDEHDWSVGMK